MKLDVIVRTHNKTNVHVQNESRYCESDKTTLIYKCIQSLINSCDNTDYEIHYHWFDDHSTDDCIETLHKKFSSSKHPYTYYPTDETGFNWSAFYQFECGKNSNADLVYLVEDDYLHYPTAISEMVESYLDFKKNLDREVAIHPFDDPDNYKPRWIEPCRIVYGKHRHWRTNEYTTNTVMVNPEVIRQHWSKFYTLATEYGTVWGETRGQVHEGTTINEIWRNHVSLFTPIPSLALHMQYKEQEDPYLNWKHLWDSISI